MTYTSKKYFQGLLWEQVMFDRYVFIVLSTLSALTLASTVEADEVMHPSPKTDNAIYLGAKAGWMHYQNACEDWNTTCDGNDTAYGLYAGYQFAQHFTFETAYLDLGQAVATYPQTGLNETYIGSMTAWEVSVLGRYGISENWEILAKLGSLAWQGKNQGPYSTRSESGWAPMVGIGLEYQWSPSWAARIEYQYVNQLGSEEIGGSHGHLTTLGISYRFGQQNRPSYTATPPVPAGTITVAPEPEIMPQAIQIDTLQRVILFDFDRSAFTEVDVLKDVIVILNQHPNAKVHLRGYTDSIGASEYNQSLSMLRALSVSAYLVDNGVKLQQIEVAAFGESFPAEPNSDPLKRYLNRRVELEIPAFVSPSKESQDK
ncbi:OmpA family protein [Shewanella marisflavi]|uniref:OmpA family protein n=1 Tax=Shewanella marisflavi TaxID=260364 RepID=UPI003AAB131C